MERIEEMEKRVMCRLKNMFGPLCVIVIVSAIFVMSCAGGKVEIDPALQNITTYKFGDSRENLAVVHDIVKSAYGNPEEKVRLERQFVEILSSDATFECKDFICRQLWVIGSDVSAPALAKMLLMDKKSSDMARYALNSNPGPKAGKALRKALRKTQGTALIGIINSLGKRRDEKSQKALKKLASASDNEVASAALAALDKISGEKSE